MKPKNARLALLAQEAPLKIERAGKMETRVGLAIDKEAAVSGGSPYTGNEWIRNLICEAVVQFFGSSVVDIENPFRSFVHPHSTVLLKPNWVLHENVGGWGMECLITQASFILQTLQYAAAAAPKKIIIGDAPIQRAIFDQIATDSFREQVDRLARGVPVEIIDFRRDKWVEGPGVRKARSAGRGMENFVLFDLGRSSLLQPLSLAGKPVFRNTVYDPRELEMTHNQKHHRYLICKEVFDADVIINMPKLKTHRKAGLTGALKNLVGVNGSKAFLPHHRVGGSALGGDCYRGVGPLKRLTEFFLDCANKRINTSQFGFWMMAASVTMKAHRFVFKEDEIEGSWYGNDTVWRMVLDLNRILLYGQRNGTLADTPVRKVYSLTDGIVAGEGFGPLAPEPKPMGCVTFAENSLFADLCHAALMGFDWKKIPLIKNGFRVHRYRLTRHSARDLAVFCKGRSHGYDDVLRQYGEAFKPSPGWAGHIEYGAPGNR